MLNYQKEIDENLQRAKKFRKGKEYKKALRNAQRALSLDPSCILAIEEISYILCLSGDFEKAKKAVDYLQKLDSDNYRAGYVLGYIQGYKEGVAKAQREFQNRLQELLDARYTKKEAAIIILKEYKAERDNNND